MTISSATARNDYTATGIVAVYDYTFRILDESDLVVTVRDADTDIETTLTLDTDYTVSGVGSASGGKVTFLTGSVPEAGDTVTIRRVRPIKQTTDIRNQGAYFPEIHEDALDHLTMVDQQQQDEIDRSMKLPESVDPADVSAKLPVPSRNKFLGWNSTGTALENRAFDATADVVLPGDGRTTDNLSDFLANNVDFNAIDYGADPDGTAADNTDAINLAITKAAAAGGGVVRIKRGIDYNPDDLVTDTTVDIIDDSRVVRRQFMPVRPLIAGQSAIEIIAHRGGGEYAPENTLAAFGLSAGRAHGAEFDVQFSSDGEAVVIHDATVDRTTDGTGNVADKTLSALQALDAGSWFDDIFAGTVIPTLEDVLAFCGPRFQMLYPEIKDTRADHQEDDVTTLVQAIIDAGLEDRCVIQTTDLTDIPYVRALSARVAVGYVAANATQWTQALPTIAADGNGVMIVDYSVLTADSDKVAEARALGVDVIAWTVDTKDVLRQLVEIGVTRIMSNVLTISGASV